MSINNCKISLFVSSFLLRYPDAEWVETLSQVSEEAEKIKNKDYVSSIMKFIKFAEKTEELALAELYVKTFDFTQKTNLYLTYYEYKEDRKRGEALLKLKEKYRKAGLKLLNGELPDFLPTILEFSAIAEDSELLIGYRTVLRNIYDGLIGMENPYSNIIEAVLLLLEEFSLANQDKAEVLGGAAK